ncbi:S1 family peptidase [Agrobacterium tumefaciens]|uniref:S1 family peptidase n=1 Tax=Agrobacterium tumefaciens TaxID=358 RepID=UPI0015745D23|nr:serine protease [Agrobacterium tumefaciens]WCK01539.1 serine protease [Agrobacterium tumefaciens]
MVAKLLDEMARNPPKEIFALMKLLHTAVRDDLYRDFLDKHAGGLLEFQVRKSLLYDGFFREQDFLALIHACGDGEGTSVYAIMPILRKLVEWGIVTDQSIFGPKAYVSYSWNKKRIAHLIMLNVIDNILFSSAYVANKYRGSIPAIYVRKGGDDYTGTGFLSTIVGGNKHVIVSAKHNVDPSDGIEFHSLSQPEGNTYKPTSGKWILHSTLDLALLEVTFSHTAIPLFAVGLPSVLQRTITLGYPRIATTADTYLLAHGGELNAVVDTYYGEKRLIISNLVSPGNSGGPVLDEAGLCLGAVVNSLETKHDGGIEKASSAIPAHEILRFITPYCL